MFDSVSLHTPDAPSYGARAALRRPLLRYHGGKWKLANWITQHFPRHRIYIEPFCGGGSILLRKDRAYAEVINDLDSDIVNLFRVLRDPIKAAALLDALRLTPFARAEFLASNRKGHRNGIERARRLIVRSFMGFSSASTFFGHSTGFRSNSNRSGSTPAHDWANYPDELSHIVDRMRGVIVEHRNAVDVIARHDEPDALIYCDPPYVRETRTFKRRTSGQVYRHDFTDDDHRRLAAALHQVKGMVLLSGYSCPLYDAELFPDWHRVSIASYADGAKPRTEVLWMNAAAKAALPQPSLFESTRTTCPNESN